MKKVQMTAVEALILKVNPSKWDGASIVESIEARRELANLKAQPELMTEDARAYLDHFPL